MTPQAPDDDRLSGTTRVRAPLPGKHGTRHRLPSEPGPAEGKRTKEAAGPIVQLVLRVHLARLVSVARIASDGRVTSGSLVVLTGVPVLAVYVTGVLTLAVYVTGVLTLAVIVGVLAHVATMIR